MDASVTSGITAVATALIGAVFAKADAKKQRKLISQIENLSLEQQKELTERAQDVQGELAKQELILKYLAVQNNNEMLNALSTKRYTSYAILGGGVVLLSLMIFMVKNKKK
jgi:hypothetical protein